MHPKKKPLPPALAAMRYEHKSRIEFGEELNPKAKDDPGPFRVAQFIVVGKKGNANYERYELDKLLSEQIRELASNLGCSKFGSMSKFLVRKEIALPIELGEYMIKSTHHLSAVLLLKSESTLCFVF